MDGGALVEVDGDGEYSDVGANDDIIVGPSECMVDETEGAPVASRLEEAGVGAKVGGGEET